MSDTSVGFHKLAVRSHIGTDTSPELQLKLHFSSDLRASALRESGYPSFWNLIGHNTEVINQEIRIVFS